MSDEKFNNKYRIPAARLQGWDYSADAEYFITICTANHECLFGTIENGEMLLSEFGKIVHHEWEKSFEMRKELFCDAFVIMPNHIHAILRIDRDHAAVETHGRASLHSNHADGDALIRADGDARRASLRPNHGVACRPPKSVSSFVAGFKSAVTKQINEIRQTPRWAVWQTRFHDHIIRNNREYNKIADYIVNNPFRWNDDRYNPM
jgi:REP element-mobilizing transposase RayT